MLNVKDILKAAKQVAEEKGLTAEAVIDAIDLQHAPVPPFPLEVAVYAGMVFGAMLLSWVALWKAASLSTWTMAPEEPTIGDLYD